MDIFQLVFLCRYFGRQDCRLWVTGLVSSVDGPKGPWCLPVGRVPGAGRRRVPVYRLSRSLRWTILPGTQPTNDQRSLTGPTGGTSPNSSIVSFLDRTTDVGTPGDFLYEVERTRSFVGRSPCTKGRKSAVLTPGLLIVLILHSKFGSDRQVEYERAPKDLSSLLPDSHEFPRTSGGSGDDPWEGCVTSVRRFRRREETTLSAVPTKSSSFGARRRGVRPGQLPPLSRGRGRGKDLSKGCRVRSGTSGSPTDYVPLLLSLPSVNHPRRIDGVGNVC